MYLLRPARADDLDALIRLARHLDSVNLPAEPEFLRGRLERSARSFAEPGPPSGEREYQFTLEDAEGRVVGTCAILSKHGTGEMPHFYLEVSREDRYSSSIDVHASHVTLRLERDVDGPTEIGALVLDPSERRRRGSPGKLLSWGRFAFIALHRACFEETVIAEMRASLDPEGRNLFWEAFGRRFTGLSYEEADRRSAVDKSFIRDLFPRAKIYASLLDRDVAEQLGCVHRETRPAVRLLERAGLRWIGQIDPFDAGPFYGAEVPDVRPIRETVRATAAEEECAGDARACIVSAGSGARFRAVATPCEVHDEIARMPKDAGERLAVDPGDPVAVTPLPDGRRRPRRG